MNRSYSKIRHIQESNLRLESRTLNESNINEALGGNDMSSIDRLKAKYPNGITNMMVKATGTAQFSNGVDKINGENPSIKNILNTILAACNYANNKCSKKVSATINGGASAVGSSRGYDNKALATRRRDNFISYLKGLDVISANKKFIDIIVGGIKVGKATVQDSPEAEKEQYVSALINSQTNIPIKGVEGDNTNTALGKYDQRVIGKGKKDLLDTTVVYKRVCVKIPIGLVDDYTKKVREFRAEHGGLAVPFGVYDIKK